MSILAYVGRLLWCNLHSFSTPAAYDALACIYLHLRSWEAYSTIVPWLCSFLMSTSSINLLSVYHTTLPSHGPLSVAGAAKLIHLEEHDQSMAFSEPCTSWDWLPYYFRVVSYYHALEVLKTWVGQLQVSSEGQQIWLQASSWIGMCTYAEL